LTLFASPVKCVQVPIPVVITGQGCQMVIFKPKIPAWANFGWSEVEHVGLFNGHSEYTTESVWYISWPYVW
jgi:hypothetical protein